METVAESKKPQLSIQASGRTDVGRKRTSNEDSFVILPDQGLFVVADGMGGHAAGEVASRLAVESIERHISGKPLGEDSTLPTSMQGPPSPREAKLPVPARKVLNAIRMANQEIVRSVRRDHSMRGMGTTVVLAYIRGSRAYIGSVGDSRAYLARDSEILQLTSDHTFVNEQVMAGTLTSSEARRHPARNILTRAVGSQEVVEPDLVEQDLIEGDCLLLCSDGLTTMLDDADILKTLRAHEEDLEAGCRALIDQANDRGGDDNVTVVLVRAAARSSAH
jgi:protein phosphatase